MCIRNRHVEVSMVCIICYLQEKRMSIHTPGIAFIGIELRENCDLFVGEPPG
jgi:hypothetical protein